jgi:hypothetical protein
MNVDLVNANAAGNWALKASNLKALLRAIELYYHDELGQLCEAQELIDTSRIAKNEDPKEICRLVELLLGCAVQCPSKSEYIHPIMQMDASEQASMMHTIEELMHRFQLTSPQVQGGRNSLGFANHEGESSESMQLQLTQALEKASQMELRVLDMERDKRELTERLENLVFEKETLVVKHTALQEERDKLVSERQSTLTRDNKKIQQIVEGEVHALTVQLEEKNEALARLKRESTERLMVLENEVRRQADELDISRSKIAQLGKLEASVSKYKKRLEEMNALRTQIKDLEVQYANTLDKTLDLESTVKTIPALKVLVEKYKNQVVELETAHVEATSSVQIKEQKIRRLQEELDSALGGKEFLESQVEELRSQLARVQSTRDDDDEDGEDYGGPTDGDRSRTGSGRRGANGDGREGSMSLDSMGSSSGSLSGGRYSAADLMLGTDSVATLRERVVRLERENSELKRGTDHAHSSPLVNDLDMALKAKESLQATVFELKRQNDQLFEELEALRQSQAGGETRGASLSSASSASAAAARAGGGGGSGGGGGDGDGAASSVRESMSVPPAVDASAEIAEAVAVYQEQVSQLVRVIKLRDCVGWNDLTDGWDGVQTTEKLVLDEEAESLRATITTLTEKLKEKESVINEVTEQKAKLETYTKKTLHAVQTKYMVAVSSHRNQLNEKQEMIEFLDKKMKETRSSYSREQALMMSAFYEVRQMKGCPFPLSISLTIDHALGIRSGRRCSEER